MSASLKVRKRGPRRLHAPHAPQRAAFDHAGLAPGPSASWFKFTRTEVWLLAAALGLYLLSRVGSAPGAPFPIHYDEGTYLHWGSIITQDPNQAYIMATWGGKQPLFIWLITLFSYFIPDAVVAGRLVAILAGLGILIALWVLAQQFFGRTAAWLGVFLYLVVPYHALFDRVAVLDGFVACLAMWSLFFSLRADQPKAAIALGLLVGASLLTKSSGLIYLPLVLLGPLAAPHPPTAYRRALPLLLLSGVIGYILYYVFLGSTPAALSIREHEQRVSYNLSLSEMLAFPWAQWWTNFSILFGYLWGLLTPPLTLLFIPALAWSLLLKRRDALLLAVWGALPMLGFLVVARTLFSRYIVFAIPPLLILMAAFTLRLAFWILERFKRPFPAGGLAALLLTPFALYPAWQTALFALSPQRIVLPTSAHMEEYLDNALWGLWEAREFIRAEVRAKGPCYVLTDWLYGQGHDATYAIFFKQPSVKLLSVVGVQTNKIVYQADTDAVLDPYVKPPAVYAPAQLTQSPCVYYVLDTRAVTEVIKYRDLLTLVKLFPERGRPPDVGVYTLRFDERFIAPTPSPP